MSVADSAPPGEAGRQWWQPEDIEDIRGRLRLHPQVTRPLAGLRVDWLQADRAVLAATTACDEKAIIDAEWRRTEIDGQILAEQVRLADAVAAVAREVERVRPGVLVDLLLASLRAAVRQMPAKLAEVLKPLLVAALEILLGPTFAHLTRQLEEVTARVRSLEAVIVDQFPASAGGGWHG